MWILTAVLHTMRSDAMTFDCTFPRLVRSGKERLVRVVFHIQQASNIIASSTWGTCPWEITVDGTLVIHDGAGANDSYSYRSPWKSWKDSIEAVITACSGGNRVNVRIAHILTVTIPMKSSLS